MDFGASGTLRGRSGPVRPDRLDRPDRPDRPDRLDRPDRPHRPHRPDCPDRPDRPDSRPHRGPGPQGHTGPPTGAHSIDSRGRFLILFGVAMFFL